MKNKNHIGVWVREFIVILTSLLLMIQSFSIASSNDKAMDITRLEKQLENSPVSEKVKILNQLSEQYISVSFNKAKFYAQEAVRLSKIIDDTLSLSKAFYNLGESNYFLYEHNLAVDAYFKSLEIEESLKNDTMISELNLSIGLTYDIQGEHEKANEYLFKSVKIEKKLGRKPKLANLFFRIGNVFHSKGDFQLALEYFIKAHEIYKLLDYKQELGNTYNSIGIVYFDLGSYEKALEYYTLSLNLANELKDKHGAAQVLNNLGIVHYECGNKERALEYYQESLQTEKEVGNKEGLAGSYNNIGIIYSDWEQIEISIDYYNKALEIYEEQRNRRGIAQAMNNIGESYYENGNNDKAIDYLMKSLNIEKEIGNKLGMAQSYYTIGNIYFELGNLNKAFEYNQLSFNIADSLKLYPVLVTNNNLFYKIYLKRNNHSKALDYYIKYSQQKDSIYNTQFHNKLAEIQSKYEIDKADKERELKNELIVNDLISKEKEVRAQRAYLIIIFFLMVVFGILVYYDIKSKIKANNRLKEINQEITKQKEELTSTLEALGKSEAKYKILVEHSPTGILYINKKGKILEINNKALQIIGSPDEEEVNSINSFKFPIFENIGLAQDIANSLKKGKLIYNESNYKSKWGKNIFLRYVVSPVKNRLGNVSSLIINIEDITASKEADKLIIKSELKYRILVENSLQAMLIVQDGDLIFANSRLKNLTQYNFKELSGKKKSWLEILLHPDDFDRAIANVKSILSGKPMPFSSEYRYIRKDGKVRWLDTLGSTIEYKGKPAILIVAIDVTERKETESVLVESEKMLKKVNATKDKFFSIIAHDLKNPFNAIMGYSNLLFEAYDNFDEKQRKTFIKNICDASESTFKLLQNLLEWSRTQTGNIDYKPEIIDLSILVSENAVLFKSSADNKAITIHTNVPYKTNVFADENMINAVIRNLISNAIKFTKSGGRVEITASTSGKNIKLQVLDTGVGIREEDMKSLFRIDDQFKTTGTADEQGTGLGLILCKEFIEKNGGQIHAESEFGVGSKFIFTLPRKKS